MRRYAIVLILIMAALLILNSSAGAALKKVPARYNVMEFYLGGALPVSTYDRIGIGQSEILFYNSSGRIFELDYEEVYQSSPFFGISYGQLRNDRILFNVGFRYSKINTEDTFFVDDLIWYYQFTPGPDIETPSFNLYDIDMNLNYYLMPLVTSKFSPFIGLGFHGGILTAKDNFETENEIKLALGLNFGVDVVLLRAPDKRSFVTFSSSNEYQLTASDGRPKYLNIGGSIKYFFRP